MRKSQKLEVRRGTKRPGVAERRVRRSLVMLVLPLSILACSGDDNPGTAGGSGGNGGSGGSGATGGSGKGGASGSGGSGATDAGSTGGSGGVAGSGGTGGAAGNGGTAGSGGTAGKGGSSGSSGASGSAGTAGSSGAGGNAGASGSGGSAGGGGAAGSAGSGGTAGAAGSAGSGGSAGAADGGSKDSGSKDAPAVDGGGPVDGGGACPTTLPAPMPGDSESAFYANDPNVPHGAITTVLYPWTGSSQPGQPSGQQRLHVYTPPNYDSSGATKYPVLYLNHGAGNDDSNWSCYQGSTPPTSGSASDCGAAGFIADNLIAAGKAVPLIIIVPYSSDCSVTQPPTSSDFACSPKYKTAIVPYVESHYPVIVDRHYRAMAGLSMGGFLTMATCLPNLATFGSCFAYSAGYQQSAFQSAAGITPLLMDPMGTNGLLDVPFYNAIGTADNVVQPSTTDAVDSVLTGAGIKTFKVRTPLGHVWQNWRRYLWQTLQLTFKNTSGCR